MHMPESCDDASKACKSYGGKDAATSNKAVIDTALISKISCL